MYNQLRLIFQQAKYLLCNGFHLDFDIYSINQQLDFYSRYKRYNQPIRNIVPIIAANALKNEPSLINETRNEICYLVALSPRSASELPALYMHIIYGNRYNGLLIAKFPAPWSIERFVQPSAALTTPAQPPSVTSSHLQHYKLQLGTGAMSDNLARTEYHTTLVTPKVGRHATPSIMLTVPLLGLISVHLFQHRVGTRPGHLQCPLSSSVWQSCSASFPRAKVNCHTKPSSVAHTTRQVRSKDGQSRAIQNPTHLNYCTA